MRASLPLLLGLALAAAPAPAADDALKQALARLQSRYETTRTLTAEFRQSVESPTLASPLESRGTLAFEKPNRMRWDYAAPDPQLIVGDGETLWIYQPADRQVIKAPLAQAFQAQTPVSFLAGLGRVERDFQASLERDEPARWVLRLVPREDTAIHLRAADDFKLRALADILREKMAKRQVPLRALQFGAPEPGPVGTAKQKIDLQQGIATDKAREIVRLVKDTKLRVQVAIQSDQVRVTGKKKDELQAIVKLLRERDLGIAMQFANFRD